MIILDTGIRSRYIMLGRIGAQVGEAEWEQMPDSIAQ